MRIKTVLYNRKWTERVEATLKEAKELIKTNRPVPLLLANKPFFAFRPEEEGVTGTLISPVVLRFFIYGPRNVDVCCDWYTANLHWSVSLTDVQYNVGHRADVENGLIRDANRFSFHPVGTYVLSLSRSAPEFPCIRDYYYWMTDTLNPFFE